MKACRARRGFVLLTALWVLVGALALTVALSRAGRDGVNAGRNRIEHERAWWRAHECFMRARYQIDRTLVANSSPSANAEAWRSLDLLAAKPASGDITDCRYQIEAAGTRLDVNRADSTQLVACLRAGGVASTAEELTAAVLDWRDEDDSARVGGAELEWYRANQRFQPRNDSLADIRELFRVRGFEGAEAVAEVLDVEPGRVALNSASAPVLRSVPGFDDEVVERLLELRRQGGRLTDMVSLVGLVSSAAGERLVANFPDIVRTATVDPDAWILTARARRGFPASTATIEARLIRNESHAVVARVRTW
jgi:type II secretory pathway component PulK